MKLKQIVAATLVFGLSAAVLAQSIGKPEDQIRWRQSAYHHGLEHEPHQGQHQRHL